jgi:hypothetical protein
MGLASPSVRGVRKKVLLGAQTRQRDVVVVVVSEAVGSVAAVCRLGLFGRVAVPRPMAPRTLRATPNRGNSHQLLVFHVRRAE